MFAASEEATLITGYFKGGEKWLCRPYSAFEPGYAEFKGWPWGFSFLKPGTPSVNRKESLVRSLRIALELANTDAFSSYTSGFAAWEFWIKGLEDKAKFAPTEDKKKKDLQFWERQANAHIYLSLVDARASAARYLKSITPEMKEEARPHLTAAAERYDEIARKLEAQHDVAPIAFREVLWTQEMREKQAKLLRECEGIERKAIDEVKMALESEEAR